MSSSNTWRHKAPLQRDCKERATHKNSTMCTYFVVSGRCRSRRQKNHSLLHTTGMAVLKPTSCPLGMHLLFSTHLSIRIEVWVEADAPLAGRLQPHQRWHVWVAARKPEVKHKAAALVRGTCGARAGCARRERWVRQRWKHEKQEQKEKRAVPHQQPVAHARVSKG